MKKNDFIYILILGEISAIFSIFVLKNLHYFPWFMWLLLVILPVLAVVAVFITSLIGKKVPTVFQLGKFASVGFANTAVDFGVLNILILIFGISGGVLYSLFKAISFSFSVVHSYFWNKFWTFRKKEVKQAGGEFLEFLIVSFVGLGINVVIASLVVNYIVAPIQISPNVWANIGAVFAVVASMAWNFIGYKFIVFKK